MKQREFIITDGEVLDLVKNGFEAYKIKVATRIFNEHRDELELSLCPECGKVARTSSAFHNCH